MKCSWYEEGICTYYRNVEEQLNDEDGFSIEWCSGDEDSQRECGIIEE